MKNFILYAICSLFACPCLASLQRSEGINTSDSIKRLIEAGVTLNEVTVKGSRSRKSVQMRTALNTVSASRSYIAENFSGSLMQSLSHIPGVKAMSIGSGQSKPVIRGLGFNRILVADNGMKHEGQQWGEDHGLETDQFAVDRVEVVKGPAALQYGSDAIGGVINLHSADIPLNSFGGNVDFFARSNNESLGTSMGLKGRYRRFFYKMNVTLIDYADYKVPIDSIQYYSYSIKLKDRRLRNTAGWERDGSLLVGYESDGWMSYLRVSNVNTKSGYFADAHGLEVRLSEIDYDRSKRDIDLPYHWVNHFQAMNHSEWTWNKVHMESNLSYQYNYQKEEAEPVSHGYMPIPPNSLERSFRKHTGMVNVKAKVVEGNHSLSAGLNAEYQHNRRGGWGFILPDFESYALGGFLYDRYFVNDHLVLSAGVRFDRGKVSIDSYNDWYKTPTKGGDSIFTRRSNDLSRSFNSFTGSVGMNWNFHPAWVFKANIGKGFRMPIAKELGMDGVNYSIFRYEKGNAELDAEDAYQMDLGLVYEKGGLFVQLSPYVNYFPNYIYLSPTSEYREGLQLYNYSQNRVLRWGVEVEMAWRVNRHWEVNANSEYLHARQQSGEKKGYTLPFSTPWATNLLLKYHIAPDKESFAGFVAAEWQIVGDQNEIVPPEEKTKGHQLLNLLVGKSFRLAGRQFRINLKCQNVFNKRYYDHTSYYRLIGVPEPGRNFSVMAGYTF